MNHDTLSQLVALSNTLGRPENDYVILGEGNTSARADSETFWVKASGTELRTITADGFVRCSFERVKALTIRRGTDDWIAGLAKRAVPCGPVNTIDKVFADPQVQHLGMAQPVEHPKLNTLSLLAPPMTISGHERRLRTATPELGEHTARDRKDDGGTHADFP